MTKSSHFAQGNNDPLANEAIQAQLERILSSSLFIASPSLSQFLQFVVTETLVGRAAQIKAYTVAIKAWGRERDFNPQADPIVRIQAGRLRRALQDYYVDEGTNDPIYIEMPKGSYVPHFEAVTETNAQEKTPTVAVELETTEPSIAILPFQNLSQDGSQALFVDGFGEELAIYLSRFQMLTVIAYYSCRRFRDTDQDVPEVGRQLGADFVVTGAIYRDDARLRISVALNDARTSVQLWGQQFDRKLTAANLFDVQDAIIEQIVVAIGSSYGIIPRIMAKASQSKRTDDLSVYEAVLRRTTFLMNLTPAAYWETKQALERAVVVDPTYAAAWAALAGMHTNAYLLGLAGQDDPLDQALECVNRALRLDPLCQDAFSVLANIHFQRRDWDGVIRACQRMVELNPNNATNVGVAGFWLTLAGDDERGLAHLTRAIELTPFYPGWFHFPYLLRHFARGEYEHAYAKALGINMPGLFWDPLLRAVVLSRMERIGEAQTALRELLRLKPDFPERVHHYLGTLIKADDLRGQMLASLHEAGLPDMA